MFHCFRTRTTSYPSKKHFALNIGASHTTESATIESVQPNHKVTQDNTIKTKQPKSRQQNCLLLTDLMQNLATSKGRMAIVFRESKSTAALKFMLKHHKIHSGLPICLATTRTNALAIGGVRELYVRSSRRCHKPRQLFWWPIATEHSTTPNTACMPPTSTEVPSMSRNVHFGSDIPWMQI